MPEVSRFYGIIVTMYFNDHNPPHFHVEHGEREALIGISTLGVIGGRLPPHVLGMVVEWATMHQDELLANWVRARNMQPLQRIDPLP
jgi:hypothetical protein